MTIKKHILLLVITCCWYSLSLAQNTAQKKQVSPIFHQLVEDSTSVIHQYGMNISPLLIQVLPLNRGSNRTGPYGFSYTRINRKNKIFRLGLGIFVDEFDEDNSHINLRIGGGKLRKISEKWHLMTGWDLMIFAGSFNTPSTENSDDGGIGFGPYMGIQYYLTSNISLSTESRLFMGTSVNSGVTFRVIPPISVFVNVNFKGRSRNRNQTTKINPKRRIKVKKKQNTKDPQPSNDGV